MMRLIDRYPEFRYIATQMPFYDYLKAGSPKLYQEVKQQIKAGNWEAACGLEG